MLANALLVASRSPRLRRLVVSAPLTRRVVDRFVAGETLPAAMNAVAQLGRSGLMVTIDHLGEDVTSIARQLRRVTRTCARWTRSARPEWGPLSRCR